MRGLAPTILRCAALVLAAIPVAACRAEPSAVANETRPALELTSRVVDAANIIPADIEAKLTGKAAALEADTGVQFVIVSTKSLEGYDIKDYSVRIGNAWGIGDSKRDDGLLLVVAPSDRKVRISTGIGLEKKLSDNECQEIIDRMLPDFTAGDLPAGIVKGADLLDTAVRAKLGHVT